MNKKVLISGGTGYIGSHISLELFKLGFDVYIVDSFINSSPNVINVFFKLKLFDFDICLIF